MAWVSSVINPPRSFLACLLHPAQPVRLRAEKSKQKRHWSASGSVGAKATSGSRARGTDLALAPGHGLGTVPCRRNFLERGYNGAQELLWDHEGLFLDQLLLAQPQPGRAHLQPNLNQAPPIPAMPEPCPTQLQPIFVQTPILTPPPIPPQLPPSSPQASTPIPPQPGE